MVTTFQDLLSRGLPATFLASLEDSLGASLLPLQVRAVEETLLLSGGNLLVSAPPAAGKTLLGDLAAFQSVRRGRPVLALVPTRAMAEERERDWRALFEPHGIGVACSTRDRRADDEAILAGARPLIVAVYEKAAALLAREPAFWSRLGLIIADEVQLLGDPTRGGMVDAMLTRWRTRTGARPQLVALSAVLGHPGELAEWLGVDLLRHEQRPVPLREGVLDADSGLFRFRDAGSGEAGEEPLLAGRVEPGDAGDLLEAARHVAQRIQHPVLVFYPTRSESWMAARGVARGCLFPPARRTLARLAAMDAEVCRERLAEVLEHGVAFHNAEMSAAHRALVEQGFNEGEIRVLCATSTLGQGVNLAAGAVLHSPLMMAQDPWAGQPALVPIGRDRLLNQGGRAARRPLPGVTHGRSIIVARGATAVERAWGLFLSGRSERLLSPLERHSWSRPLAEITRLGIVDPGPFFQATFAARAMGPAQVATRLLAETKDGAVNQLWRQEGSRLRLTARGEVHATTGISSPTLHEWARYLSPGPQAVSPSAVLFLAAFAEDEWEDMPLRLPPDERRRARWPRALLQLLGNSGIDAALRDLLTDPAGAPRALHIAARRAIILQDWLAPATPVRDLEEKHGLTRAQALQMRHQAAWLVTGMADLAGALGAGEEILAVVEEMAARLSGEAPAAPQPVVVSADASDASQVAEPASDSPPQPILRFVNRAMGIVEYEGRQVSLTPYQFRLLEALAECPMQGLPYSEIERRVWQGTIVERQQVAQHRRSVELALLGRTSRSPGGELIRTRHRFGLYLNLPPEAVSQ